MKPLGSSFVIKEDLSLKILKRVRDQMIYYDRAIVLSIKGRCISYLLVVLLTKECRDTGMTYR